MAGLHPDDVALAALAEAAHDQYVIEKKLDVSTEHVVSSAASDEELDGIHDGLEFPTDEERLTLRRVSDTIPWNAYLIAFIELCERFSYYGSTVVFTNFIQQPLPPGSKTGAGGTYGQSGALDKGQQASTGLITFNSFWVFVVPLFGAYIADTYLGRFKTVCWCVVICLVGHTLLIISAIPEVIANPNGSLACFVIALVIMGSGTGGFKANISPLVAEQYQRSKLFIQVTKKGERVIVDPQMTTARIYMYFYLFVNIGSLIGQIGMSYSEKYVGYWLAFTLPTALFLLCPLVLFFGYNSYKRSPPTGSVLVTAMRVLRLACKGRFSWNPVRFWRNMYAEDFWEGAKPSNFRGEARPRWMTFDDQWVEEVARGFKACVVFLWYPMYWLTYNQINNNLVSQAATMSTHGVPNDILSNLDPFALIIFIPICDFFVYPALARMGWHFTPIKKIALGFITGATSMIWACVLQYYVYKTNPCGHYVSTCTDADGNTVTSTLNVWIQTGAYVLLAFSEIFASITGLEYAFTKAPKNMRSLVMAVFLFMSAVASAIGEAFVPISIDPLLIWNYGVMAVLAGVSGVIFWFQFRHLDAIEDELNDLGEGNFGEAVDPDFDSAEKK